MKRSRERNIQDPDYGLLVNGPSYAQIARLKALLTRAADALERIEAAKHWQWTIDLAAELRKAAE